MATIVALLKDAVRELRQSQTQTPVLDAEVLLLYTMKDFGRQADRIFLMAHSDAAVDESIGLAFMDKIKERCMGKPVQYITKVQEFMGLEFCVRPGVLIPRPDTEIIVEKLIALFKTSEKIRFIDMCTGTGAIAISLAHYLKVDSAYAVDLSEQALQCCRENSSKHRLEQQLYTIKSNLFEALKAMNLEKSMDLVVSNPPYIEQGKIEALPDSVKCFEPLMALDGGIDGLDFYRRITREAAAFLKSSGVLAFEIGYNQGEAVMQIIKESGFYTDVYIEKDLAGLDRCVWARCH